MGATVSDSFNRTGVDLGANWSNLLNGWVPNNGAAHGTSASASGENSSVYSGLNFSNDHIMTCTVGSLNGTTDDIGLCTRMSGTPHVSMAGYVIFQNTTTLIVDRIASASDASGGTTTGISSLASTGAPGDVLTIFVVGNTITINKNSTQLLLQVADNTLASGGPGVFQFGDVATLSSFGATNFFAQPGATANVVCDGDSITWGFKATTPYTSLMSLSGNPNIVNLGVPSKGLGVGLSAQNAGTIASMISTGAGSVDALFKSGISNVVVIWGGTNDIANGGRTAAQAFADLQTYCAARRAAGWKTVVVPALSRATNDSTMQAFNALIAANNPGDALVSFPSTLVGSGAFANTTYFVDGVHPTQFAVTNIIAPSIGSVVGGFLASSVQDCRVNKPNSATFRTVQGTQIDDVQTSSNTTVPGTDSRAAGVPVDSRAAGQAAAPPQNSRAALG